LHSDAPLLQRGAQIALIGWWSFEINVSFRIDPVAATASPSIGTSQSDPKQNRRGRSSARPRSHCGFMAMMLTGARRPRPAPALPEEGDQVQK
jgi:hypothetical protein